MKVLNVIPGLATVTGGPPFAVVNMANALTSLGVEPSIYATDAITSAQAQKRRYGVGLSDMPPGAEMLDIRTFPVRPPRRILYSPALRDALNSEISKFDLVHIHSLFLYPQFAAYRAALSAGIPYVVSPRGALDPFLRQRHRTIKRVADLWWQGSMLRHAAAIHLTAQVERDQLVSLGHSEHLCICPNAIGSSWFSDQPSGTSFRNRLLGGFSGPVVMVHGRLTLKKGLDVLMEAVSLVRAKGLPVHLVIVGPDDEGMGLVLHNKSQVLGLHGSVTFAGMLSGDDLHGALAAADVWALPSQGENFGIAVVEAMAAGLPVVISPQVNIADAIAEEGAAVIAKRNPDAFAEAIFELLQKPEERRSLGSRAKMFAKRYDANAGAARMLGLYEEALLGSQKGK